MNQNVKMKLLKYKMSLFIIGNIYDCFGVFYIKMRT